MLQPVPTRAPLDVFRYDDYRAFLRAYYELRKGQQRGISLRAFSKRVGLRSPNYLKLVMDGDRNLPPALALRFGEACGLAGAALEYFCALVAFNQAKSPAERAQLEGRLRTFRRYRDTHKLAVAQESYHAHWYVPAIRELAARADFEDDPRWVAKTLWPEITPVEAKRALSVLRELGLLLRDGDKVVQREPLVETANGPLSHHVVTFHREMMRLASEAIERVPREQREIASLTLCLSAARARELKQELEQLETQLLQRYGAETDGTQVVQLNLQLFPLSRGKE